MSPNGQFNGPIGRIGVLLGIMKRTGDKIGKIGFFHLWRNGTGEIHQLGDDFAEPMALIVDEMGHRFLLGVR